MQQFTHAEATGEWPQQYHTVWLAPLSKDTPYPTAGKARPISILPTTYRLWASTRLRQHQEHLLEALPPQTHAYLQGRSAQQAALQVAEIIEEIQIANQQGDKLQYHIMSLDCTKAFPTVCRRKPLALGISQTLTAAIDSFYQVTTVKWRLMGMHIEPDKHLIMEVGIHQGCPLSVAGYNAVLAPLIQQIEQRWPNGHITIYADDVTIHAANKTTMQEMATFCGQYFDDLGISINPEQDAVPTAGHAARSALPPEQGHTTRIKHLRARNHLLGRRILSG